MVRRGQSLLPLALLCLVPGPSRAVHGTASTPSVALVQVAVPTHEDLVRFQRTGLSAYARLYGNEGDYLLIGANPADLAMLAAADLPVRILDADVAGASYYLAYTLPSQPLPNQPAGGQLLLNDGVQALLRLAPGDAARLAAAGVELSALSLEPRSLQPTFSPEVIPAVVEPDPFIQSSTR
jgi:hypothetical protein